MPPPLRPTFPVTADSRAKDRPIRSQWYQWLAPAPQSMAAGLGGAVAEAYVRGAGQRRLDTLRETQLLRPHYHWSVRRQVPDDEAGIAPPRLQAGPAPPFP